MIQGCVGCNEWQNFAAIRAVYDSTTEGTVPLLSADNTTLLTEKTRILERWAEHFRGVLNCPSTISDSAIARLPQVEINADLGLPPYSHKTIRVMQQFSIWKTSGSDAITAEIEKRGGRQLLTAPFQGKFPQGRHNHPSQQAERQPTALRRSLRHLLAEYRRENICSHPPQLFKQPPRTRSSAGKPVRLPTSSWDHRHDLRSLPTSGEVPGNADPPVLYIFGSDESPRHGKSRRTV
nr:unnamed protein product [Spirometra erinaceieuropaei]